MSSYERYSCDSDCRPESERKECEMIYFDGLYLRCSVCWFGWMVEE
jgi:hypothetical protein